MRRLILGLFPAVLFMTTMISVQAAEKYVVENGNAKARIYLPRVSGKATLFAAKELSDYIGKITGAKIPIDYYGSGDRRYAVKNEVRIVLEPKLDPARKISADGSEDVFTIEATGDSLTINGNSDNAVLYGVYQYLHDLGVRWFMPGEIGENIPIMKNLPLKPMRKTYKPSFRKREIDYSGYDRWHFHPDHRERQHREYDLWLLRNRCQFCRSIHWNPVHRYDMNWTREYTYHNIGRCLRGVDIKKEPERFPLVTRDGKQERVAKGAQICLTNPKNIQATIDLAVKWFAENPDKLTYPCSLEDHGGICECKNCVKANGGVFPPYNPNQVVWKFMNQVAQGIRKKLPNKRIAFYACYGAMTEPPKGMKAEPGIVAVTCHVQSNRSPITDTECPFNKVYYQNINNIKRTGAEMECYEYTMFAGTPQPTAILSNIRAYHDLGYVGYHTESMGRDEQRNIIGWCQAQMAWDASRESRRLLTEFCVNYYGAAGWDVLKILDLLDSSIEKLPKLIMGSSGITQSIMTDKVIAEGRGILALALKKVNGRELVRLRRFNDTFEMMARRGSAVRAGYQAMDRRAPDSVKNALAKIADFEDYWLKHDLSETCSPKILGDMQVFGKIIEQLKPDIKPVASKDLAGAKKDVIVKEMFSLSQQPATLGNLFLLPEVWKFKPDINRTAVENGWLNDSFDDSKWHDLSTYNFYERQGFDWYDGSFCYRVKFNAPQFPKGKRVFLRIGALDDEGEVYVNGKLVLKRLHLKPNDWLSSFEVDVTDSIKPGVENTIIVLGNDEYGMGGIWKPSGLYTK